jgi:hypothetical protein
VLKGIENGKNIWIRISSSIRFLVENVNPACPPALLCPVGPEDRTGVESFGYSSGVGPEDRTGAISVVNRKFSYLKKLINLRTSLACFKLRKHVKKNTRMF